MEENISFEKVGDINYKYSFLEVYVGSNLELLMDIRISEDQELIFNVYKSKKDVVFTLNQWSLIMKRAIVFKEEEIRNENTFDDFMKDFLH